MCDKLVLGGADSKPARVRFPAKENVLRWYKEKGLNRDKQNHLLQKAAMGRRCGSVVRVVASNTRGPRIECSHRKFLDLPTINWIEKTNINKKDGVNGPIFNKSRRQPSDECYSFFCYVVIQERGISKKVFFGWQSCRSKKEQTQKCVRSKNEKRNESEVVSDYFDLFGGVFKTQTIALIVFLSLSFFVYHCLYTLILLSLYSFLSAVT